MTLHTYKVEATHTVLSDHHYVIEKQKAGMNQKDAELTAHKWAKAGYFAFVVDEATGECIGEAPPIEGD
jgi:hypothetical protein